MNNMKIILLVLSYAIVTESKVYGQENPITNVMLVHGAFADRSGWKGIYDILSKKGYHTTIVQIPMTSLKDDVAAVNRALDRINGKVVLVGHSWSGTVITEAGIHPNVASLVYISAFAPDKGENTLQWVSLMPPSSKNGLLTPDNNGFVYYDKAKFHDGFAADLNKKETMFMADMQQPIAASCFTDVVAEAAWHDKPSYSLFGSEDMSIDPIIFHKMFERIGSKPVEIKGASHVVFMSHPKRVAEVIIEASK